MGVIRAVLVYADHYSIRKRSMSQKDVDLLLIPSRVNTSHFVLSCSIVFGVWCWQSKHTPKAGSAGQITPSGSSSDEFTSIDDVTDTYIKELEEKLKVSDWRDRSDEWRRHRITRSTTAMRAGTKEAVQRCRQCSSVQVRWREISENRWPPLLSHQNDSARRMQFTDCLFWVLDCFVVEKDCRVRESTKSFD